jgi:hypothetical protein
MPSLKYSAKAYDPEYDSPAASRLTAMRGKKNKLRVRRPKVSIVKTAGLNGLSGHIASWSRWDPPGEDKVESAFNGELTPVTQ